MTKILIVDDHQENLYMLSFLLEKYGYVVEAANHGQEALEMALQSPPDLIVADIFMPIMDGFTLCREWQKAPMLRPIPFIFYTATYTDEKDKELGLSLGAVRFILKPAEPEELVATLQEVIKAHESGRLPTPDASPEAEPVFLKQYNERLIKKLEDKMMELEQANKRLEEDVAARTAELTIALQQAQTAAKLKSQFVSDVNHELRTPLNNITLYLSLLQHGPTEKQSHYITVLQRETERLQWLISQLLDLSRLDSDRVAANLDKVDINQLLLTLVADRRQLVIDRGLSLDFEPAPNLPAALADHQLLFQVLTNLLVNAMNYTPAGGAITLKTSLAQYQTKQWITISVSDTGLGIADEELPHLFERFHRGKAALISGASGAGLGLPISQEIMQRHGGRITVHSQLGKGSQFIIWLCAKQ